MGGAFQTSREIFKNPIWMDVIKFRLFFFIVGNAVFSEDGVKIGNITLQRGQFLRSYRNLSEDLQYLHNRSLKKYSISVLKKKVDQLVKENRLKVEDTELGTLFTVVNYAIYQDFNHYKKVTENGARTARERSENNNNKGIKVNKDNKKTSCPKYEICDYETAELLFKKMQENNQNVKSPNLEKWANEVRLMREQDKRTIEQIQYLINWTQKDSFWKTNILSISKLRKQWDQLVLKCKESSSKQGNTKNQAQADPRERDFALARWVENGGNPEDFNWGK